MLVLEWAVWRLIQESRGERMQKRERLLAKMAYICEGEPLAVSERSGVIAFAGGR
jgi:hypothetical protein